MARRGRTAAILAISLAATGTLYVLQNGSTKRGDLVQAVLAGDAKVVGELLNRNVSPNTKAEALHSGNTLWTRIVRTIVGFRPLPAPGQPLEFDEERSPVLILAVNRGQLAISTLLLMAGADPNCRDQNGRTPLMQATFQQDTTIARRLVVAGANVSLTDAFGNTALDLARANSKTEMVRFLEGVINDQAKFHHVGRSQAP